MDFKNSTIPYLKITATAVFKFYGFGVYIADVHIQSQSIRSLDFTMTLGDRSNVPQKIPITPHGFEILQAANKNLFNYAAL